MLVAPLDVQVRPVGTGHLAQRDHVDRGSDARRREHEPAAHVGRRDEAPDGLDHDRRAEQEQSDAVRLRREDLGAPETERHPARRRPPGEPRSPHSEAECRGVDEHMRRVREQRQRVGDDRERDLRRHETDDQRQCDREGPNLGLRADPVVVAVMVAHALSLTAVTDDGVVFVEIPSGSRNKYEWDEELGGLVLDRRLFTSMSYPADYGYLEGTLAEDGDPLDALVLVAEATFPGCRIRVRAVGVFHMADEKGPDEKVLCVPLNDPSWSSITDIHDVPPQLRNEIEHFFQVYKDLEGKTTETRGFGNRSEARGIIAACRERISTGRG